MYKGQWKHLFVAVKRIQSKKDSGAAVRKFFKFTNFKMTANFRMKKNV